MICYILLIDFGFLFMFLINIILRVISVRCCKVLGIFCIEIQRNNGGLKNFTLEYFPSSLSRLINIAVTIWRIKRFGCFRFDMIWRILMRRLIVIIECRSKSILLGLERIELFYWYFRWMTSYHRLITNMNRTSIFLPI